MSRANMICMIIDNFNESVAPRAGPAGGCQVEVRARVEPVQDWAAATGKQCSAVVVPACGGLSED